MSTLSVRGLRFGYAAEPVLDGLDLEIPAGALVGVVGPNGSGKSTLLKLMAGLLRPQAGSIALDGRDLRELGRRETARRMALIPQQLDAAYPFSVGQAVLMGRYAHRGLAPFETAHDVELAQQSMAECGVLHLAARPLNELSGGERQRVLAAAALTQQPRVLLADEPTSSLDLHYQIEIYRIFQRLNQRDGLTVIAVTHDLNLAALFCPRIVLIGQGRVLADGPAKQVLRAELLEPAFDAAVTAGQRPDVDLPFVLPTLGRKPE